MTTTDDTPEFDNPLQEMVYKRTGKLVDPVLSRLVHRGALYAVIRDLFGPELPKEVLDKAMNATENKR